MHPSVREFAADAIKPLYVEGNDVLEAGAYDENGTIRPLVEAMGPKSYTATDMRPGPGVDMVCPAEKLPASCAELVISMEMLEHAENWRSAVLGLTLATKFAGWLVITTRGPGFPYHGFPGDYFRFSVETMQAILVACGMDVIRCESDPEHPGVLAVGKRMHAPDIEALVAIEAEPAPPERLFPRIRKES